MTLEIRQAKPEEMEEVRRVAGTALMLPIGEHFGNELTLCAFKDGKVATSYGAWNLNMRMNGSDVPVAGVTMVGTLPVYRRLGCLRKVTTKHFEILHEEGKQAVAALYASRAAIYRRYGYSVVTTVNMYEVEPRYIQFIAGKETGGSFREAGEDDVDTLGLIYDRFIEDRTGYLRRSADMWKRRLNPTRMEEGHKQFTVIYEEDGEPQGYVIYQASLANEGRIKFGQKIMTNDLVWLTPSAYRAIWEFFSRMDVILNITHGASSDDPLPHLLMEPRMLNRLTRDGVLARIVDVECAMDKRQYDAEGKLIFRVTDKLCPWNEGVWKLETSPDGSTIKATDESPQLEMPVSTLPLLYFGQLSATEAARMGRLDVNDPDSLDVWDRVMKTRYRPACADGF